MARIRRKLRGKTITPALSTDYQETFPGAYLRSVFFKFSGVQAASGAGTSAGDGGFGLLDVVEIARGADPLVRMKAADWRWLTTFLSGGQPEHVATINNALPFLAQASLAFDRLIPRGGIDARGEDVLIRGRLGAATALGTTVTGLTTPRLSFGGESDDPQDGDHFEPRFWQRTQDVSSSSTEHVITHRVGEDTLLLTGLLVRQFDASLALSDPSTYRTDGLLRELRVDIERTGGTAEEVTRRSWGEIKGDSTFVGNVTSSAVPTGVGFVGIDDGDPAADPYGNALVLRRGDAINVRLDTASTIEPEFTATTPAAGDLIFVTFLGFVPRGPSVEMAKASRRG